MLATRGNTTATARFASGRDSTRALEALTGADAFERGQPLTPRFDPDVRGLGPQPSMVRAFWVFVSPAHAMPSS